VHSQHHDQERRRQVLEHHLRILSAAAGRCWSLACCFFGLQLCRARVTGSRRCGHTQGIALSTSIICVAKILWQTRQTI
jgi:hypothetical protein